MPKQPKKPASLTETSSEELRPALTAENFHEHPDTPSDQLSSFVHHYTKTDHEPDAPVHQTAEAISKHPNLATSDITDFYNHLVGTPTVGSEMGKFNLGSVQNPEIVSNLLTHKNAAPSIAENFLERTINSNDFDTNPAHAAAASHPGVSAAGRFLHPWTFAKNPCPRRSVY